MAETIARCLGMSEGVPCVDTATCLTPVPLCTPHRMEVAIGIVPAMLDKAAGRGAARPPLVLTQEQERMVREARAVPVDLDGPHPSRVYLIEHGSRVKIGYTTNLRARLDGLTLRPSNVLMVFRGGLDLERALHLYFDALRVDNTEWFRDAEPLRRYVEERAHTIPAPRTGPLAGDLVTAIRDAIGGDRGVHLGELLPRVEHLGIADRAQLRDRLDAEGIPVRRSMRTATGVGRSGVHRDDVARVLAARGVEG
ncbi:GIY-YIG nuclease family protein [Streptomyces sp. NBC_01590]|uniref:GIY-YIG nuclease family protein n=1 Tax=Streptomyces sp. NBC_01590 TaxID=2975887 RepID=UPI003863572E